MNAVCKCGFSRADHDDPTSGCACKAYEPDYGTTTWGARGWDRVHTSPDGVVTEWEFDDPYSSWSFESVLVHRWHESETWGWNHMWNTGGVDGLATEDEAMEAALAAMRVNS